MAINLLIDDSILKYCEQYLSTNEDQKNTSILACLIFSCYRTASSCMCGSRCGYKFAFIAVNLDNCEIAFHIHKYVNDVHK